MRKLHKELEKQRGLLCRLAVQGLFCEGNRTPSDAVIAQSRKVDTLISAIEQDETAGKKQKTE